MNASHIYGGGRERINKGHMGRLTELDHARAEICRCATFGNTKGFLLEKKESIRISIDYLQPDVPTLN